MRIAVAALGRGLLADEYAGAWDEWDAAEDSGLWEQALADGIG